MSFLDSLKKNLTPEMYAQVTDALGDDFDFDLVPRTRLNKVIAQRNTLRDQLAGLGGEPGSTPKTPKADPEEPDVPPSNPIDTAALEQKYKNQAAEAIRGAMIQYAALLKLREAGVVDPEMVWSSNVLDKAKIKMDEHDKITGMDEMLAQLKTDKAYLFNQTTPPAGTGKDGGTQFEGVTTRDAFLKLDVAQQIAFKQANPEIFKKFMKGE
nr:MAG TPA: minor structural protein [Caudoviricetes sp.]